MAYVLQGKNSNDCIFSLENMNPEKGRRYMKKELSTHLFYKPAKISFRNEVGRKVILR